MKSPTRISLAVIALLSVVPLLVGCTSAGIQPQSPQPSQGDPSVIVPVFSGTWANEFTSAFRESKSGFERQALEDETITDAEFAELENTFNSCLEGKQVTFKGFKPGGGYGFTFSESVTADQANQIADDCSASTGVNTVGRLYFAMQRNPQNLDEPTILANCLVEKTVVPKGYTAADYSQDAPTMTFPFFDKEKGEVALESCGADPLGLVG